MSPIRPPAPEPPEPPPPAPELFFTLPAMASRGSGARSAASERNERGEKEGPLRQPPPALAAQGLRGRCPPGGAPLRERGRRGAGTRAGDGPASGGRRSDPQLARARELTSTRVHGRSRKALTKFPRPQLPPRPSGTGRGHPGRGPEETRACALCWRSEVWKERGGVQGRTCALGRSRACRPCSLWTGLGASRSESLLCLE